MATPDQIPTDLTLDIGVDLAPEAFLAAVKSFFGYVDEVVRSQTDDGKPIDWLVQVKDGSNLVALAPPKSAPLAKLAGVYDKLDRGIAALDDGRLEDAALSDRALKHLRKLSQLTQSKKRSVPIKIWVCRRPIVLGPKIAARISEDWQTDYSDIGTLEGRLHAIQDGDGKLIIQLKDSLFEAPIRCYLEDELAADALSHFRDRVEVYGTIHYRRNGTPISIEAVSIDAFPEDQELPTAEDVRGILAIA